MGSVVSSVVLTVPEPRLQIVKSANRDTVRDGDTVKYTLTITNNGFAVIPNVVDFIPAGSTLIDSSIPGGCAANGAELLCLGLGVLAEGESIKLSYEVKVGDAQKFTQNQINAQVYNQSDPYCSSLDVPEPHCRSAVTLVAVTGQGGLADTGQSLGILAGAAVLVVIVASVLGVRSAQKIRT